MESARGASIEIGPFGRVGVAPAVLPEVPPGGVTAGLDWATAEHAASVIDAAGHEIARYTVEHTAAGLQGLVRDLRKQHVGEVAIERADGPVVDALRDGGMTVVVINPSKVKHLRARYGSAGNKDDRFDAFVLADTLRTDRARLVPLTPDSEQTIALRQTVRTRRRLVETRVAIANQLRAHLQIVLPGVIGLFADLDSPISLAFLTRYDSQDAVDRLTPKRLATWLTGRHYSGRTAPSVLHAHLTAAPRGATGDLGALQTTVTHALVTVLLTLRAQIRALDDEIGRQFTAHPDAEIFNSLPRSGTIRAARLLAEIGDRREKAPTAAALACLAGVAPSTRQSGKLRVVTFRWSCDKQLRDAICDFADGSRHDNPWAKTVYDRAIARDCDHAHAIRILARAWLTVIWACWQHHQPYDPTQHRALQALPPTGG